VFDIAYGLCDEIERLRAEISSIKEDTDNFMGNPDNVDGP